MFLNKTNNNDEQGTVANSFTVAYRYMARGDLKESIATHTSHEKRTLATIEAMVRAGALNDKGEPTKNFVHFGVEQEAVAVTSLEVTFTDANLDVFDVEVLKIAPAAPDTSEYWTEAERVAAEKKAAAKGTAEGVEVE